MVDGEVALCFVTSCGVVVSAMVSMVDDVLGNDVSSKEICNNNSGVWHGDFLPLWYRRSWNHLHSLALSDLNEASHTLLSTYVNPHPQL